MITFAIFFVIGLTWLWVLVCHYPGTSVGGVGGDGIGTPHPPQYYTHGQMLRDVYG
jgi:hypothetical protein